MSCTTVVSTERILEQKEIAFGKCLEANGMCGKWRHFGEYDSLSCYVIYSKKLRWFGQRRRVAFMANCRKAFRPETVEVKLLIPEYEVKLREALNQFGWPSTLII